MAKGWRISHEFTNAESQIQNWSVHKTIQQRSHKFLEITNLTHFFMHWFISCVYTFRASQRSSSGDLIVLIHHLVWLVCVSDCLVCRSGEPPDRHTKQSLTQTNNTRWFINTIWSPDDERCDTWNMYRHEINKCMKKCVKLVISKNL